MKESNAGTAAGVVLVDGRTRLWVRDGVLHWQRGRSSLAVPGARIRRVECTGSSLLVDYLDESGTGATVTARHRDRAVTAALGAEVRAIVGDLGGGSGSGGSPAAVERHVRRPWPVRLAAGLSHRVRHGSRWWRAAVVHVLVGLPAAVWLPVEPRTLGVVAWALLPLSPALLRAWVLMAELDTLWVLRRRGVTVRARFESDPFSEHANAFIARFRTLEGRDVAFEGLLRSSRDEIRYDPQDPSRADAAPLWTRLLIALAAFVPVGSFGVVFALPALAWLALLVAQRF
ncbi:hypothetical protein [Kitasatospora sp. NPDC093806]|uniref:hypothetical protein n=1 Tax=Kitasatospora sp. NPDC093806 TaxID=3155075 RepID=UPI0034182319